MKITIDIPDKEFGRLIAERKRLSKQSEALLTPDAVKYLAKLDEAVIQCHLRRFAIEAIRKFCR